jgi:ribonucleoside-diphosphate reductase alpha chain
MAFEWLTDESRLFLSRGYISADQTAEERLWEIAQEAERILMLRGFADKFYDYLGRGYYSLSSPIWANFGADRGLSISCNGSYVDDSMESILTKQAEIGMMTKYGAGTSIFLGALRPRGAPISQGGNSYGAVHFAELYDRVISIVSQSNVRRGACAVYLPVEHADVLEFLNIRQVGHPIQELQFGVTVSDAFMESVRDGDPHARKVWAKVLESRYATGLPYIVFSDNMNKSAPQVYQDKRMRIYASNLCVTGDQRVVSQYGLKTAKELYQLGTELTLFDNTQTVKADKMQLVEKNADVYRVVLDNGMQHTVTNYHKLVKRDGNTTVNTEVKNLRVGDYVAVQTNKGIFGTTHLPKEAFLLGMYQGDGTQANDRICFDLWENDFDLASEIQEYHDYICDTYKTQYVNNREYNKPVFRNCIVAQSKVAKKRLESNATKKALNFTKGVVPEWIWSADEETLWQYIRGLYYTDGTVRIGSSKGEPLQLSLSSVDRNFLEQIQIILANLGMQTSIRLQRREGVNLLPDGHGSVKEYSVKPLWRLIIGNKNDALIFNKHTQFLDRKGIELEDREYRDNTKKFYKIVSIEYVGKEDVYCTTVHSDAHLWVCNGFITHNCTEIALHSNPDESFVCNLSSMNLVHYDEWKNTDAVKVLSYFLDAVLTDYIDKTENLPYMQPAHNFAKNQRAIGIGVLGWHSYLQSKMIAYESMEAKMLNSMIWKFLKQQTDEATKELAEMYGEPDLLIGYGRRNVTMLAVAPTKSSSFIHGQVSASVEPYNDNYGTYDLAKIKHSFKNPYLKKLLQEKGLDTDAVWLDILEHGGSVQHVDYLTEHEKAVFKTFGEISQREIIIQAASRQIFIDQAQSINLRIDKSVPVKEVNALMFFAWENGIKSLYYQYGVNAAQMLNREINNCVSCEA